MMETKHYQMNEKDYTSKREIGRALEEVENLLCKYSFNEINELRYNVARHATSAKLRKTSISSICKELVEISYYSLKTQLEDEEKFLEPIMELLKKGKTPCEI